MKLYKFENGTVKINFKKDIFCNFFNDKIQFVCDHKHNGYGLFYTARDAFNYIRNNQLTIKF